LGSGRCFSGSAAALIVLVLWPAAFATADDDDKASKAPFAQTDAATAAGDRTGTLSSAAA
jgi:hypothetical protein